MDKFIYFSTVSKDIQTILEQYRSPEVEASIWKWVPIKHLAHIRQALRNVGKFRIVYRGPRGRYHDQAMTWKQDARAFTVYPR